jgi:glutamate 5-kinase
MRVVIKVGTSTLTHATGRLNIQRVEKLCRVMSDLKNAGHELILVSSDAIGMGVGKLSLSEKPGDLPGKQAAAAVGQCELMYVYDKEFSEYNHIVAQILITGPDVEQDERRNNFQKTLIRLLELGALPIINENDYLATNGRSRISATTTPWRPSWPSSVRADLLVLSLRTSTGCTTPIPTAIPTPGDPVVFALTDRKL